MPIGSSSFISSMLSITGRYHRYVPHANKALRSFNMYYNIRKPPLSSVFPFSLLPFLFSRQPQSQTPSVTSRPSSPARLHSSSTSSSIPISPIPPTTNPRGELIFSSRVHPAFREAYERYRAAFERKREEREREAMGETWWGWLWLLVSFRKTPPAPAPVLSPGVRGPRGRGTPPGGTPGSSRRGSPAPGRGGSRSGTPKSSLGSG